MGKGITTGTNAGSPISERATLVSIQDNCQTGHTCGFFSTEGACVYELTLLEIQGDDRYIFEAIAVSGAEFCLGTSRDQKSPDVDWYKFVGRDNITPMNLDFIDYEIR